MCMSTFSNIFSSEATGPIEAKFHMEPHWDGGTKVCSNGPRTFGTNLIVYEVVSVMKS